ncbi:MAG: hypothetical protein RR561_02245 [Peptostreptococcus sp.]|uniref:DUF6873 family GME fold protein n=1 Tax=Peptostreptococcus sp. TaxID=1262 RepID=UPI002FC6C0FF
MDNTQYAIIDYRMDLECRKNIEKLGIRLINSYKNENVYEAINGHVDINIFQLGKNVFVSPESYEYYREEFMKVGLIDRINLLKGRKKLDRKYPKDIAYNMCFTGRYAIGSLENIDITILNFLEETVKFSKVNDKKNNNEIEIIDINQGYANCSICQIDENSVITSDKGISKELKKKNIDVLEISQGNIDLFDFDYGFIGGASASIDDRVCFFGDIIKHPDYSSIKEFVESKNKKILSLSNQKLIDYGGLIII